jgi:hypothetical protein
MHLELHYPTSRARALTAGVNFAHPWRPFGAGDHIDCTHVFEWHTNVPCRFSEIGKGAHHPIQILDLSCHARLRCANMSSSTIAICCLRGTGSQLACLLAALNHFALADNARVYEPR